MARKTEEYKVQNVDVELEARHLFHAAVPVMKYAPKAEREAAEKEGRKIPGVQYHVNIQFKNFEDIVNMALDKVLHAVGHEITAGRINKDGDPNGYTTVDSSGKAPKSAIESAKELVNLVHSAKEATEKAELIKDMK
jgi:hypothetical protein